jgi:hypothetical protein
MTALRRFAICCGLSAIVTLVAVLGQIHFQSRSDWYWAPLPLAWVGCLAWYLLTTTRNSTPTSRSLARSAFVSVSLVMAMALSSFLSVVLAVLVSPD